MTISNADSNWIEIEENEPVYVDPVASWKRIAEACGVEISEDRIRRRRHERLRQGCINLERQFAPLAEPEIEGNILIDKMEELIDLMVKNQRIYNNRVTAPPRPEPTPDPRKPIIRQVGIGKGGVQIV